MTLLSTLPSSVSGGVQAESLRFLRSTGLPTKKTEAWRFTSVRDIVDAELPPTQAEPEIEVQGATCETVDGHALDGLGVTLPNVDFVALNTVMHARVHLIEVAAGAKARVHIRYRDAHGATYPRTLVRVGQGAELVLLEELPERGSLLVPVTEVLLGANSRVEHSRIQRDVGKVIGALGALQGRDSRFSSRVITLGGELVRLDVRATMNEPGASCDLRGAFVLAEREHADHHIFVDHVAAHCHSEQHYRGVLDDKSTGVFDGQAHIRHGATHSEAHQSSRNILLADGATMFTKPHLEIENDDVVASHGATVGALEEEQLFYLQARGVPADLARAMLIDGFLREIAAGICDEEFRSLALKGLADELPGGDVLLHFREGL